MGIKRILRFLRGSDANFTVPKIKGYSNRYMSTVKVSTMGKSEKCHIKRLPAFKTTLFILLHGY